MLLGTVLLGMVVVCCCSCVTFRSKRSLLLVMCGFCVAKIQLFMAARHIWMPKVSRSDDALVVHTIIVLSTCPQLPACIKRPWLTKEVCGLFVPADDCLPENR